MTTHPAAHLLIVDDEVPQMKALCETLRDAGYQATGFSAPHEALAALRVEKFDLVLTDLKMPGMDGLELLRAALAMDEDLVAIMMTGHGTVDTAVEAMKIGAFDYIRKPFKLSAMLPVLERAVGVRRLRQERAELVRHLKEQAVQLEAANQEMEAFSYSAAHDLRAPLRAVSGYATMLEEDFGGTWPPEARRLLQNVKQGAANMGRLIDDLLRFSRISRQPLTALPVALEELVGEVVAELQESQNGRDVRVVIAQLPGVRGDRALLRQVFHNLLGNALKFTRHREPPVIEVGCDRQEAEQRFFVRDNGAGFDMRFADKLFGVFQRMHSNEEFEGTGIGLSIVQRIVHRHGGRIWADAKVDGGATFFFTLPPDDRRP